MGPASTQDLEIRVHQRERAREKDPLCSEPRHNPLDKVLSIDSRGLQREIVILRKGEFGVDLAKPRDVDLTAIGGYDRDVRETTGEITDLETFGDPGEATCHDD